MIHSSNEWGRLREVVVGRAWGANWPSQDPVFSQEQQHTQWKETPPPSGPVPTWVTQEADHDLDELAKALIMLGVKVHRPMMHDFRPDNGMYNYCPRDRVIIADDAVIDCAMMYPARDREITFLSHLWSPDKVTAMPRDQGLVLDAANVCRLGDDWLYLISRSGNLAALEWLRGHLPHKRIHACNFYAGVHIDSTILPLREGVVMVNAARVTPDTLPEVLRSWKVIWIDDCEARDFYQYPYASKWVGMNVLSVDPHTVIVDSMQTKIITTLENNGFTVVPLALRHSRTLGGGFHCVTLDLWREHD